MLKGILNFQIENFIKTINDKDMIKNFAGVFLSDKMTRIIDYKQLIKQKTSKHLLFISSTENLIRERVNIGIGY